MKKIVALLLALVTVFALPACGKNSAQIQETSQIVLPETTPTETSEVVEDNLHEHTYTSRVTAPTCTADGYTTYTCSCGESYVSDKVPFLGHSFGDWVTTLEPTETATGLSERKCSVCGTAETNVLGMLIAGHTHSYTEEVVTTASCTREGEKRLSCQCGEVYTEKIAKTPHDYKSVVKQPDCVNGGYTTHTCTVCSDSYVDSYTNALDHAYDVKIISSTCIAKGSKITTCTRCNAYKKTEKLPIGDHTYTEATCTQPSVCSVCAKQNGKALGHSYGTNHLCTRCGAADPNNQPVGSATYTVTVRSDKSVPISGVTVTVYVGNTQVGSGTTDSSGVAIMTLSSTGSSYKLVLSGVPEAYEVKESYTFSSITVNINLKTVPVLDPNDHSQAMYTVGSTMANFVLTDVEGNTYDLSQLRQEKKLIILDFWYVNCGPCKKEFPYFEAMLEQYGDDVILLAVNDIDNEDNIRTLREELNADPATAVSFPMIRDTLGLAKGFGVRAYPLTAFIDPDGKVVYVHPNAFSSQADFISQVEKYLK